MEQIGRAMQVQSELLKQMHERQRMLEEVVKDNRRHELMINSAQALNESFQGLQRVQERLSDQLRENSGASRGRSAAVTIALLLLVAVGGFLAWRITESADSFNANLKAAFEPGAREREVQDGLARLETRLRGVEDADRAAFRDEIDKLRSGFSELTAENQKLAKERDKAHQDLGAASATLGSAHNELTELRSKVPTLEKDNARLTAQGVADQKTIVQLNDVIAMMKESRAPGPASPAPPPAAPTEGAGETARKPAPAEMPPAEPRPATIGAADGPTARAEPEVTGAGSEALAPFATAQLDALNALLKNHRGSDRYELKKVERVGQKRLWNVVMEVRGPDGEITKTIEAKTLGFLIDVNRGLLEIEFQGGHVTFQGTAGRSPKSPFFNDRYLIVVLGANGRDWAAANYGFVQQK
jgi:hypothetical protein